MSDRAYFATAVLVAALLIAFAFVWPQGFGRRSPGPFGGPEIMSQAARADLAAAAAKARAKIAPKTAPLPPAAQPSPPSGAAK
jgi:hypothetical protein